MNDKITPTQTVVISDPNYNVVGTCSLCGGKVVTPVVVEYMTLRQGNVTVSSPKPPFCKGCGATKKQEITPLYGPIVEMERQ